MVDVVPVTEHQSKWHYSPGVSPTPWAGGEFKVTYLRSINLAHQVPATVVLGVLIVSGKT